MDLWIDPEKLRHIMTIEHVTSITIIILGLTLSLDQPVSAINRLLPRHLHHLLELGLRVSFRKARHRLWHLYAKSVVVVLTDLFKYVLLANDDISEVTNWFTYVANTSISVPNWMNLFNNIPYFVSKYRSICRLFTLFLHLWFATWRIWRSHIIIIKINLYFRLSAHSNTIQVTNYHPKKKLCTTSGRSFYITPH